MKRNKNLLVEIASHSVKPRPQVWDGIAVRLGHTTKKRVAWWWLLNKSQVASIAFTTLATIGISAWLYHLSEPIHSTSALAHPVFTTPSAIDIAKNKPTLLFKNKLLSQNNSNLAQSVLNYTDDKSNNSTTSKHLNKIEVKNSKENKSNINQSNTSTAKLLSTFPAIESVDGTIKLYKNSEWITLSEVGVLPSGAIDNLKNEAIVASEPIALTSLPELEQTSVSTNFTPPLGVYAMPFVGGNFSFLNFSHYGANQFFSSRSKFGGHLGYSVGLQMGYQISPKISIESGAAMSQYVSYFTDNLNGQERNGQLYIDQLEIPLLFRYQIAQFGKILVHLKGGFLYSSLLNYQLNYKELNLASNILKSYQFDNNIEAYNSLQLGYAAGVDFNYFLKQRLAFGVSALGSYMSRLGQFPHFKSDSPSSLNTSFSAGVKVFF